MTINFGENLKRLRKEKELTQETLADFLGVSFQAVSKWERGETYPDITMLPVISSFFGVSIDELIGVDKVQKEQKINEYLELYDKINLKDTSSVFLEFQKAVKEFPGDFRILIRYMELLRTEKDNPFFPDYEKTSKELMSIYSNIQKHCTDDSIRIRSKRLMCEHFVLKFAGTCNEEGKYYTNTEYQKRADDIISELPSMADSREFRSWLYNCVDSSDTEKTRIVFEELLFLLGNTIELTYILSSSFSPKFKIEIISHLIGLFNLIFPDGNYGKNLMHVIYNYGHLGHLYFEIDEKENAIKHFRIAAEIAKKADKAPDVYGKSARFFHTGKPFREMTACTQLTLLMKKHYPLSDEFRETPEFKEIIEVMENIDVDGIVL